MRVDRAELARLAIGSYPHGQAAVTGATAAALAKVPEPTAMILVEGVSDQIAVETLAARRRRDLSDERVAVVPMGGAGAIRRVLAEHTSATMRLVALCTPARSHSFTVPSRPPRARCRCSCVIPTWKPNS